MHYVAVLDYIFLAFGGWFAGGSDGAFAAEGDADEVIVLNDLGSEEAFPEVCVEDSLRPSGFVTKVEKYVDRHFVEDSLRPSGFVTLVDDPGAALV